MLRIDAHLHLAFSLMMHLVGRNCLDAMQVIYVVISDSSLVVRRFLKVYPASKPTGHWHYHYWGGSVERASIY